MSWDNRRCKIVLTVTGHTPHGNIWGYLQRQTNLNHPASTPRAPYLRANTNHSSMRAIDSYRSRLILKDLRDCVHIVVGTHCILHSGNKASGIHGDVRANIISQPCHLIANVVVTEGGVDRRNRAELLRLAHQSTCKS